MKRNFAQGAGVFADIDLVRLFFRHCIIAIITTISADLFKMLVIVDNPLPCAYNDHEVS